MGDENNTATAVSIALLQQSVLTLSGEVADLKNVGKQQSEKIDMLLTKFSEARGGWRTILWLGGVGATFGGFVAWALAHLRFSP